MYLCIVLGCLGSADVPASNNKYAECPTIILLCSVSSFPPFLAYKLQWTVIGRNNGSPESSLRCSCWRGSKFLPLALKAMYSSKKWQCNVVTLFWESWLYIECVSNQALSYFTWHTITHICLWVGGSEIVSRNLTNAEFIIVPVAPVLTYLNPKSCN